MKTGILTSVEIVARDDGFGHALPVVREVPLRYSGRMTMRSQVDTVGKP